MKPSLVLCRAALLLAACFHLSALAQPSPNLPPTRLAPGANITITTNGVNNFTIASGGSSSVTNYGQAFTNISVYSSGTTNQPLRVFGGTQTNSNPLEYEATWNNSGVNFTGLKLNVTNTASGSGSKLADLQVGGSSVFSVWKSGRVLFSTGGFYDEGMGGLMIGRIGDASANLYVGYQSKYLVTLSSDTSLGFGSGSAGSDFRGQDTAITRDGAGIIQFNNGTAGTYRDARLRTLFVEEQASDPTPSASGGALYAKDVAGDTELFVIDSALNVTQISPHARASSPAPARLDAADAQPIVIHHSNALLGREEWIHLSAMARKLEQLTGEKFLFSRPIPGNKRKTWAEHQAELAAAHNAKRAAELAELAAWRTNSAKATTPEPKVRGEYVVKPQPDWLNN